MTINSTFFIRRGFSYMKVSVSKIDGVIVIGADGHTYQLPPEPIDVAAACEAFASKVAAFNEDHTTRRKRPRMEPYRAPEIPRRNMKCPCGSGKKAKHCCLPRIKSLAEVPPLARVEAIVSRILQSPAAVLHKPVASSKVVCFEGTTLTTSDGIAIPVESAEIHVNSVPDGKA